VRVIVLHSREAVEPPPDPVIEQVIEALRHNGHEARALELDDDVEAVTRALRGAEPELVFNLAESFGGKSALESNVAALLNLLDLRYTGSSPAGLMLAGDKTLCKKVLCFHGVRTPQFATAYRGAVDWAGDLSFPVIVKPPQEDASLGVSSASVVRDIKQLLERMDAMQTEFQQPVLVEQYIDGREYYVGIVGNANAKALPIMELDFSDFPPDRPRIASWAAKWGEDGSGSGAEFAGTRSLFPTDLDAELAERMGRVAADAFHALRLRDYARVDLRVTEDGEIYVIEVNPNPYLERQSEFARAAERDGMDFNQLIARVVELAMARYAR
jgi:D-alanine-D-alanine ligase